VSEQKEDAFLFAVVQLGPLGNSCPRAKLQSEFSGPLESVRKTKPTLRRASMIS